MTVDRDSTPDAAALLSALSGLAGMDDKLIGQAQQAMADAMSAGAEHRVFLERQWTIMQATADAVRRDGGSPEAAEDRLVTSQHLAQARACFDVAIEAVRALSAAANAQGDASMDQVVKRFHDELTRVLNRGNK